MSKRVKREPVRCYRCRKVVADKDVWWMQLPAGRVPICATDWSYLQSRTRNLPNASRGKNAKA